MFELLFKYSPLVFERGRFAFGATWPTLVLAAVGALVAIPALISYARARGGSSRVDRLILSSLRLGAFAVVLFCLFRPTLVLSTVVPQQNFLGILVDDSRSMRIADGDEEPRSALVARTFGSGSPLVKALEQEFTLRWFRFSDETGRVEALDSLDWDGTRTRIGPALDRAREELSPVPLSGLILVTDGADNSDQADLSRSLLPLQASGTPVYTVGVGRERLDRDIQLGRMQTPRRVLLGASVVVDAVVAQSGFDGRTVPLQVEDQGRIVSSQEVSLPRNGEPATVRLSFTADRPGPRIFRFRVPPQDGEMVTQNNVREVLVQVEDRREKILYFEGEPRYEVKFIRRAVEDDDNLQVVVLQRTAANKYLRLNVDSPEELAGGFPRTREELFRYRGLVLGSVEAAQFTPDQLAMIEEFVSRRGGGILALGGRRAFSEGGYAGTPVADVLPVVLDTARTRALRASDGGAATSALSGIISALVEEPVDRGFVSTYFDSLRVEPTRAGLDHPVTRLADSPDSSEARWGRLPPLSTLNPIHELKPAATALLTGHLFGEGEEAAGEQVVLAYQRYGRGKALAFTVQDSWLWQMHADMPLDDMTHENLWRQLLRWLVDGVPDQVRASLPRDRSDPGHPLTLAASVDDPDFLEVNDGDVSARVTAPSGAEQELRLDWTVQENGRYEADFSPREEGLYEIEITASVDGDTLGTDRTWVYAAPGDQEYFDPGMRAPLLRRIARETGGRFYTPGTVSSLADDVTYTGGGVTVTEALDLWDMPVLLLLVLGFVGVEWGYRKARGLA